MSWALPLATFIHSALGHGNLGTNDVNKGQCTGLVALWLVQMHKPLLYADGKDMLLAADPNAYHVELNGPSNYPTPGAVVSWKANFGAGHGHTAIAVAANANQLVVFEQNDPDGAPALVATHDYTDVLGWLSW